MLGNMVEGGSVHYVYIFFISMCTSRDIYIHIQC